MSKYTQIIGVEFSVIGGVFIISGFLLHSKPAEIWLLSVIGAVFIGAGVFAILDNTGSGD